MLSVCQQQHLCSFIQTCYLNRRKKKIFELWPVAALENLWAWVRCRSGEEYYVLQGRMLLGLDVCRLFLWVFLLKSAKCRVHYKNCSWEPYVLLLSVFCHSRKLWLWQSHSTHQWRMAMLCATHLSRTQDTHCFCFSFSRINHCSHASMALNL